MTKKDIPAMIITDSDALSFPTRLGVAREYGTIAAYVYELILMADPGNGAAVTHADIAEKLSISVSSVQRAIRKLTHGGLLTAENHQRANRYQTPTPLTHSQTTASSTSPLFGQNDRPGQKPVGSNKGSSSLDSSLKKYSCLHISTSKELLYTQSLPAGSAELAHSDNPCLLPGWAKGPSGWPVPPVATGKRVGPFSPEIFAFVEYFEALVTPLAKRRITDDKRDRWCISTHQLLVIDQRPFDELVAITTWLFRDCGGMFPFKDRWGGYDEKVTRVDQLRWNYEPALGYMQAGFTRSAGKQVKTNYNQPLAGHLEDQVNELIELFAQFRGPSGLGDVIEEHDPPGDRAAMFKRYNWAKTFRLMLHHDGYEFEDIKLVITSLRSYQGHIDTGRYHSPFNLRLGGEFDRLLALVVALREANVPGFDPPMVTMSEPSPGRLYQDGGISPSYPLGWDHDNTPPPHAMG